MAHTQMDTTFFVESDDGFNPSITPRQAAKLIARRKQELIGNELSRLAADEYLEDVMKHMGHMEARRSSHHPMAQLNVICLDQC